MSVYRLPLFGDRLFSSSLRNKANQKMGRDSFLMNAALAHQRQGPPQQPPPRLQGSAHPRGGAASKGRGKPNCHKQLGAGHQSAGITKQTFWGGCGCGKPAWHSLKVKSKKLLLALQPPARAGLLLPVQASHWCVETERFIDCPHFKMDIQFNH